MKRTEQLLALLAIIGISTKLFGINGGLIFSTLSILLIAIFHYIFSFALLNEVDFSNLFKKEYYQEKSIDIKKIITAILLGWSLSVIEIAILFNLALWPGKEAMMWTGMISTLIFGLTFIILNRKNKKLVKANLYRMLIVLVIGFVVINISLF